MLVLSRKSKESVIIDGRIQVSVTSIIGWWITLAIRWESGAVVSAVLTQDCALTIEPEITIVVVQVVGDKCRLGFEADREITIHRAEVQELVDREKGGGQ
jgi:carbon storage regulator CsrA